MQESDGKRGRFLVPKEDGRDSPESVKEDTSFGEKETPQRKPSQGNSANGASTKNPETDLERSLPRLLRPPTDEYLRMRRRYPFSAHKYFESYTDPDFEMEDPYQGLIVWSKMSGHATWPARMATKEEMEALWSGKELDPSQLHTLDEEGGKPSDQLMLYYLGSDNVGNVRRSTILPYLAHYKEFAGKGIKQLQKGLEEADGLAMRRHFADDVGKCMACGRANNPENIIICDRCNSEAHMQCMTPKMTEVPTGDWFCPVCQLEAPLSYESIQNAAKQALKSSPAAIVSPSRMSIMNRSSTSEDAAEGEDEPRVFGGGKVTWTTNEDRILLEELFRTGGSWETVAKRFPGKSPSMCKNRHTVLYRKGHAPGYAYFSGKDASKKLTRDQLDQYLNRIAGHGNWSEVLPGEGNGVTGAAGFTSEGTIAVSKPKRLSTPVVTFQPTMASDSKKGEKNGGDKEEVVSTKGSTSASSSLGQGQPQQQVKKVKPIGGNGGNSSGAGSSSTIKRGSSSSSSAERVTSQIGQMLEEVLKIKKRDHSLPAASACSICNLPSADVFCDDDNCDRAYHSFCLGDYSPTSTKRIGGSSKALSSSSSEWFCPWHSCTVCRQQQQETGNTSSISGGLELHMLPASYEGPPTLSDLVGTTRVPSSGGDTTTSDETENNNPPLLRCCACPLALCRKHQSVPTQMMTGEGKSSVLLSLVRTVYPDISSLFFACERCAGYSTAPPPPPSTFSATVGGGAIAAAASANSKRQSTSMFASGSGAGGGSGGGPISSGSTALLSHFSSPKYMMQLPRVFLARVHDKALSEVASKHNKLFALIMKRPSVELVSFVAGQEAVDPFFSSAKAASKPLSLEEIQSKVRRLEYASTLEFRSDVTWMSDHLAMVYERRHPRLAEACRSLPHCLNEALLDKSREIVAFGMGKNETVGGEGNNKSQQSNEKEALKGLMPFETYERNELETLNVEGTVTAWKDQVFLDRDRTKDGGKTALSVLVQALEAAKLIPGSVANTRAANDLLTPSREDLEQILENHSAHLRAALRTAAEIRSEVMKLFAVVDGRKDEEDDSVLMIGGGQTEAERAAAHRSLKAKLDETRQALELEKKARLELEHKLSQSQQQQPSKSGKNN